MNADDHKLSALLRSARATPALPPRFQLNVWRRIEEVEASARPESWLDALAALILRPRFAFATASLLLLGGMTLGVHQGALTVRHDAQIRYLASVEPPTVR
jgi:hypothetical protein